MSGSKTLARVAAMAVLGLGLATSAHAFSFGTFLPGDKIVGIELSASFGDLEVYQNNPFDATDDQFIFETAVSRIDMLSGASFTPTLGDVTFSSQLKIQTGYVPPEFAGLGNPVFLPPGPGFGGLVAAYLANGLVADFTIMDVADSNNLLLAADYTSPLQFRVQKESGVNVGSLLGQFEVLLGQGDPAFEAAFGDLGTFFSDLTGFQAGGPIAGPCDLSTSGLCLTLFDDFKDFTAEPTTTITPVQVVPEPGALALLCLGLAGLGSRRRGARRRT